MARYYLLILKIANSLIFFFLILTVFLSVFRFNDVLITPDGELVLTAFLISIRNIFSYLIYSGAYIVALGITFVVSYFFYLDQRFMFELLESFFRNYFSLWFNFPSGMAPRLEEIPSLLGVEFTAFLGNVYLISFLIFFILSIVYAIKAFIQTDPKNELVAIGSLVVMIVIPLIANALYNMLRLFIPSSVEIPYLDNLPNPLDPSFFQIPLNNIFLFFTNPIILLGIMAYIYLEMAFQINYIHTVTKPSLERSDRLEAQITILENESHYITANVDKIKEEAKKKKEELEIEERTTVGKFFAKSGESFSYVKEMIAKRKLEEEEKKLITAASKTRRLGRYINRLTQEDPEAYETLTAKSSTPKPKSLVFSTLLNFFIRVGVLVLISYIIITPQWILTDVFRLPPAIVESVVMLSPEIIIILLLPILVLFPAVAKLVSYIKHRSLIIRLQQEGRIKEILASVGDYVKKEATETVEKKIEIEGTPN